MHPGVLLRLGFAVLLMFTATWSWGQDSEDDEIGARQLSDADRTRLHQILKEPLDMNALKLNLERQIQEKLQAAMQLGDRKAEEELFELALQTNPSPGMLNNVARIARDKHNYPRAIELHQMSLDQAAPVWKPFYMAHLANDHRLWGKNDDAEAWIKKAESSLPALQGTRMSPAQQRAFLRAQRFVAFVKSFIEVIRGRLPQAIEAAEKTETLSRKALQIQLPGDSSLDRNWLIQDLGDSLARKVFVYRAAGRLVDAEQSLRDYLRFAKEVNLSPIMRSGIYEAASSLRFAQRDFLQAQKLGEKSLDLYLQAGRQSYELGARNRMLNIAVAFAGQGNWPQAQILMDRIDQTYPQRLPLNKASYPFDRAYIALGNGKHVEAAALFERTAQYNQGVYGDNHFFTAQSRGLQGVALWRSGKHDDALRLLESSVKDMVNPVNAEYLDSFGYRPEARQTIISTYISALADKKSPQIIHALGLADWLKAGSTQEALADAAVRAAAQTQGLADLVRQEQDARNEIKGLREYLAGQAGDARSTLPEVASKMRDRINLLEKQRQALFGQIKAAFPGYERLVRPLPPKLDEIAQVLKPDEALLFLMPDEKGVHVWAVTQNQGQVSAHHHWTAWPLAQLHQDIIQLRQPLEALGESGVVKPFPHQIAHQIHEKLIAPLGEALVNKPQWIIAASGPLARIPFSLLQTKTAQGQQPPQWLIDRVALTHVPSVGSWLNLRALPRNVRPDQSLYAWGDPTFKPGASSSGGSGATRAVRAVRSVPSDQDLDKELGIQDNLYYDIPPLPETREELIQLAKALKAQPEDLVLGEKATRQSVLQANQSGILQRKRVVVFATHGLMSGDLPGLKQPALAMAANGEETRNPLAPLLTLEDVLGLKLNSDWVVLSACNTAAGDGKAEEALSGLARGFFYAGSRAMLVTHWAVESDSAKELTTRTFAHFSSQNDAPKAESLRQAILQVKSDPRYGHPVFWAPYVLVGDSTR